MVEQYTDPNVLDTEGAPQHEAIPAGSADAGAVGEGSQGTPEEWRQAYDNRTSWERSLKQKDQQFAHVRKVLETAFGRSMNQWNAIDLSDLQAFAMINSRIRSDSDFAKKWHKALQNTFEESGSSPAEAKVQATEALKTQLQTPAQPGATPAPPQYQVPPEIAQRLTRMEQIAVQQEFKALENSLWGELDDQVKTVASDLADYGELIQEQALHGLFFHSDAELIERAHNGTLPELVGAYVKQAADRVRGISQASLQRRAAGNQKKPVAPAPFGAGTAPAAGPNPEKMTMKEMGARLKAAMSAVEE